MSQIEMTEQQHRPLVRVGREYSAADQDAESSQRPCSGSMKPRLPGNRAASMSTILQAGLMFAVIALGCANVISKQIVAKSLVRFSYLMSLTTTIAYAPIYWAILFMLIKTDIVPMAQLRWAWRGGGWEKFTPAPYVKLYMIAALGDAMGDVLGYICTPYVSGPIHSLLAQFTVMFTVMLSLCILHTRYSFAQCLSLLGVEIAVVIGVIPSLGKGRNSTDLGYATLLGGSCFFNAIAFVVKELSFDIYKRAPPAGLHDQGSTLSIFIVNSHEALFQLPFTLLMVPLAQATGQTKGEDVFAYLQEGMSCLAGTSTENPDCVYAGKWTALYVLFNVLWNLCILLNVKFNGALATFVALKAISPISALLFAYVDWPLLHTTPVSTVTWCVLVLITPCIGFYTWASIKQKARAARDPSLATCCWPFGERSLPDI